MNCSKTATTGPDNSDLFDAHNNLFGKHVQRDPVFSESSLLETRSCGSGVGSVLASVMEGDPMDSFREEQQGAPPANVPPSGPQITGGKRVYVGNLSWDTRWQGLKDHMREAGDVAHAEVFTEASGRSAGCGIVEFETPEGAELAINKLNDSVLDGRSIFVRADREEGKPRRFDGEGGGYGGRRQSDRGRKIVVWNLPYHIRWQDLKDLFREYGNVIRADVPQTQDGKSRGMGTVLFESEMEADRAIQEMTGKEVDGRVIDCRLDKFA